MRIQVQQARMLPGKNRAGPFAFLLALVLGAGLAGCERDSATPKREPGEQKVIERLPAEFYGTWKFARSSGGIDGRGNPGYAVETLVLREPNLLEEHRAGGAAVHRTTFTAGRGKSIFSTPEVWQIRRGNSPMIEVVTLSTNRELTLSENVYDGFSYTFKGE